MPEWLYDIGVGLLAACVLAGSIPLLSGLWQYALIGVHGARNHLPYTEDFTPHTAVVVPAWNEAAVIGGTIDRLTSLNYPEESLRVYVVDDASDDGTPEIVEAKAAQYPGRVFHLRREDGGQGKAHTLNHGLEIILGEDWADAVLIIDADVIFERDALRRMTRHLADPEVGSVTAYIKEGSYPANYMKRFIGFEYVTAQAAARRSQNVIGAMACLAGGAQLHSRESLVEIGGHVDVDTLAEDTVTTLLTQVNGRRAIFEGNAVVWAEEPGDVNGLWKQRLRWARGNVQVNRRFRKIWFRRWRYGRLGGFSFGLFWYATFLMPAFMITSSISLVCLYLLNYGYSLEAFRALWMINVFTYVVVTSFSLMIDPETAKKSWRQAIFFPGFVSLLIIIGTCFPPVHEQLIPDLASHIGVTLDETAARAFLLFAYVWLSFSMVVAWLAKVVENTRLKFLAPVLVYTAGFGALLSANALASWIKEARGEETRWEKTEKTGQVAVGA
ncbi:MAG: glycosyltransferase family 2 protein [Solirubrobacterales bacterium]|nr:glycosyltransferase family 2 protein [Solirubrobacterales bacterium]